MSMENTSTETTYVIKKADGTVAMEIIVRYNGLDYQQLMATTEAHLAALQALTELGKQEAAGQAGNAAQRR